MAAPIVAKYTSQKHCKYRAESGIVTFGWQRSLLEQSKR